MSEYDLKKDPLFPAKSSAWHDAYTGFKNGWNALAAQMGSEDLSKDVKDATMRLTMDRAKDALSVMEDLTEDWIIVDRDALQRMGIAAQHASERLQAFRTNTNNQTPVLQFKGDIEDLDRDVRLSFAVVSVNRRMVSLIERAKNAALEAEAGRLRISAIQKQLEDVLPTAMVTLQANHFGKEVTLKNGAAKRWLCVTIGLGVILVLLAVGGFLWSVHESALSNAYSTYTIVSLTVPKIVLLSITYYAFVVALKNYRAHRHLAVAYEQKKNALRTFKAFVEAAGEDKDTKNAVLLATTGAIFNLVPTGYNTDQPDPQLGPLLDAVRSAKSG